MYLNLYSARSGTTATDEVLILFAKLLFQIESSFHIDLLISGLSKSAVRIESTSTISGSSASCLIISKSSISAAAPTRTPSSRGGSSSARKLSPATRAFISSVIAESSSTSFASVSRRFCRLKHLCNRLHVRSSIYHKPELNKRCQRACKINRRVKRSFNCSSAERTRSAGV